MNRYLLLVVFAAIGTKLTDSSARGFHHRRSSVHHAHRCSPGWGLVPELARSRSPRDRVCLPCEAGTYSSYKPHTQVCRVCSQCGEGLYIERPCRRTHDTRCGGCASAVGPFNADYVAKCRLPSTTKTATRPTMPTKTPLANDYVDLFGDYELKNMPNTHWEKFNDLMSMEVSSEEDELVSDKMATTGKTPLLGGVGRWPSTAFRGVLPKDVKIDESTSESNEDDVAPWETDEVKEEQKEDDVALKLFYDEARRQRLAYERVPDDGRKEHEFWRFSEAARVQDDKADAAQLAEIEKTPSYHAYALEARRRHTYMVIATVCVVLAVALTILGAVRIDWLRRNRVAADANVNHVRHRLYVQLTAQDNQIINECAHRLAEKQKKKKRGRGPFDEYYWADEQAGMRVHDNPMGYDEEEDDEEMVVPHVHHSSTDRLIQ